MNDKPGFLGRQAQREKWVIFLAEDDHDDILMFESALDMLALDVELRVYIDGSEVVSGLGNHVSSRPGIVFLDINMPRKNGLECLRDIRTHISKQLPVFLLTTAQDRLTLEEARKLGATGYLSKPSSLVELSTLLQKVLSIDWQRRSENDFYLHLQYGGVCR